MDKKRYYRNREEKMFLGVFSGIADYFNLDVAIVRVIAVLVAVFTNIPFVLTYFIIAICTEER